MIDKTTMSAFEALYLTITGVGIVAVSVQLWIQRKQISFLAKTLEATANASVAQRTLEVDKLFVEKPHLRTYFYERQYPDQNHLSEANAMALLILNYFDTYFIQRQSETSQLYPDETWDTYLKLHFDNSPFLCKFLFDHQEIYTTSMREFASRTIGGTDEINRRAVHSPASWPKEPIPQEAH